MCYAIVFTEFYFINQVKILSEVEQKKIVDDESQPILKALKKIVPVSYEVVPIPAVPTLEK